MSTTCLTPSVAFALATAWLRSAPLCTFPLSVTTPDGGLDVDVSALDVWIGEELRVDLRGDPGVVHHRAGVARRLCHQSPDEAIPRARQRRATHRMSFDIMCLLPREWLTVFQCSAVNSGFAMR